MARPAHAQPGFTLIELVISVALAALLVVPLSAMVFNALSAQTLAGAANDLTQDARFAMQRMEAAVRAKAPATLSAKGPTTTGDWLSPVAFCLRVDKVLIETVPLDFLCLGFGGRHIASSVTAFSVMEYSAGASAAKVIEIQMTLTGTAGQSLSLTSRTRMGGGTL